VRYRIRGRCPPAGELCEVYIVEGAGVCRWCKSPPRRGAIAEVQWLPERLAQVRQTAARRAALVDRVRGWWPSLPHAWPEGRRRFGLSTLIVPGTALQAAALVLLALRVAGHQLPRIGHSPTAPRRPHTRCTRPDADHRTGDAGRSLRAGRIRLRTAPDHPSSGDNSAQGRLVKSSIPQAVGRRR
jgi:hypothetical protein